MSLRARLALCVLVSAVAGCVYVPVTHEVYDADCGITARYMTLEARQVGVFTGGCRNDGCAALLVGIGAVTAASAVVSGSVVLAGNVVYWFEKRGSCQPVEPQH